MADLKFDKETTALLIIDPYNDFISEGGKIWDRIKNVAEANNCVPNMSEVMNDSRRESSQRPGNSIAIKWRSIKVGEGKGQL